VRNHTPIFLVRDAIMLRGFIHSQRRNPHTNLPDPVAVWNYLSLTPESVHQATILFSDRSTSKSFCTMDGFSSRACMWSNEKQEHV